MVANIINYTLPEAEIIVFGRHWEKLELFSFAKECYITDNIPEDLTFDHGLSVAVAMVQAQLSMT